MKALLDLLTNEYNTLMQYEILLMLLLFLLAVTVGKRMTGVKGRLVSRGITTGVILFFAYLHRILLPFLVSGVYVLLLAAIPCCVLALGPGLPAGGQEMALRLKEGLLFPFRFVLGKYKRWTDSEDINGIRGVAGAVILTVLMIQLCRINIAIDYDSFRYGLRSDVLLGKGLKGFFDSLGLVNAVYTYPKGFELLTLPLYSERTFGYVLCVNIWVLILCLCVAGEIAFKLTESENGDVLTAAGCALVPGITNMAVTAKTDLVTLLLQLVFVLCLVCYLKGGCALHHALPGTGAAALVLSLSFKATAPVFSGAIGVYALIRIWKVLKKESRERRERKDKRGLTCRLAGGILLLLACAFTLLITARTFVITGMPYTGVYTGLFEKLGFTLKYPFRAQAATGLTGGEAGSSLPGLLVKGVLRLYGFFLCPSGEDMAHMRIAWGGIVFTAAFLSSMALSGRMKRLSAENGLYPEAADCVKGLFRTITAVSLAALLLVGQADGNYFMLLYALSIITAVVCLYLHEAEIQRKAALRGPETKGNDRPGIGPGAEDKEGQKGSALAEGSQSTDHTDRTENSRWKAVFPAAVLVTAFMIYFTAFTGWAGAVGFTPPDLLNRGYYDHRAELPRENPVGLAAETKVVAFAKEPECYFLSVRVESWVDIDGTGGNVYLTDTKLNIFKQYLSYAGIDCIYADLDWLKDYSDSRHERAHTLFVYLLEDGCFSQVMLAENTANEFYAVLDKERTAQPWEEPLSQEKQNRTRAQCDYFRSIGGY